MVQIAQITNCPDKLTHA